MATAATHSLIHTPVASLPAAAAEQPLCSDLCARVQAVWEAFCACIASYATAIIDWCVNLIHGTSRPLQIPEACDEPKQIVMAPSVTSTLPENWERLSQWYHACFGNQWTKDLTGAHLDCRVDLTQFSTTALKEIQTKIRERNLLFFAANRLHTYTKEIGNGVENLLKLGADPLAVTQEGYTPLHCAVLSGSFLAYKTLRQHKVNPEEGSEFPIGQKPLPPPIRLAQEINVEGRLLSQAFHRRVVMNVAGDSRSKDEKHNLRKLFPYELINAQVNVHLANGMEYTHLGHLAEIRQMIDFEEEHAKPAKDLVYQGLQELGVRIAPQLAQLIAEYGKYYT